MKSGICWEVCGLVFRYNPKIFLQSLRITMKQASAAKQMRTALFWAITMLVVVTPCRRFGRNYRSHLQGLRILKMGPIVCPETSVRNYHCQLCNSPRQRSSQPRTTSLTVPGVRLQMNWDFSKFEQQCYPLDCGFRISQLCSDFIFWDRRTSGYVF